MEPSGQMTAGVGTVAYMAPEVMDIYSRNEPADVCFSFVMPSSHWGMAFSSNSHAVYKCPHSKPQVEMDASKCDVFSFAILALYVATGCPPYEGLNNKQIFLKVAYIGGDEVVTHFLFALNFLSLSLCLSLSHTHTLCRF